MYQQTFYGSTQGLSNHFMPTNSYFYRAGPIPAASNHHLNFTRDFDCFPSMPSGARPYYDAHKRWKAPFTRLHTNQTQAFHFQDKSTFYFMSEPIRTSDDRIVIQLTKVHIGPNGDQQRVFVEQEFSNNQELKRFVRNLRENFEKTFNHRATGTDSSSEQSNDSLDRNSFRKSGVFVVEEPDEEPKVYPQKSTPKLNQIENNSRPKRKKPKKKSRRSNDEQSFNENLRSAPPVNNPLNRPKATAINENFHFKHFQNHFQPKVQRTRSDCRQKVFQSQCAPKFNVRTNPKSFVGFVPKTDRPLNNCFYPSRRIATFKPIYSRLFQNKRF